MYNYIYIYIHTIVYARSNFSNVYDYMLDNIPIANNKLSAL